MKKITINPYVFIFALFLSIYSFSQENTALTCADGIDNDGDLLIDCNDPDCQNLGSNGCEICTNANTFADVLIEYVSGCDFEDPEPEGALGISDYNSSVSTPSNYVVLGQGGFIKLGFTNNILTNSGDSSFDIYVFEIGPAVEASIISLRPANAYTENELIAKNILDENGDGFYEFGTIGGSTRGFDIDKVLPGYIMQSLKFNAIEVQDVPNGSCSGTTPGADIDAVCALSSFALSTNDFEWKQNAIKIYPNPFNDKINIEFDDLHEAELNYAIISVNGQTLQKGKISNRNEIDLKHLSYGMYFLRVKLKTSTITKKIFKY